MKKTRRIAAFIAAMAMAATLAVPSVMMSASAAATENTISFTAEKGATHQYTGYQIFKGTVESNELKSVQWAMEASKATAFLTALKGSTMTLADGSSTLGSLFNDCTTAAAVAEVLGGETFQTAANVETFAEFAESQKTNLLKVNDTASATVNIQTSGDGYYLVIDETTANITNGAYSRYILQQVDASAGIEVTVKSSIPTVVKKVKENVKTGEWEDATTYGAQYNDVADYTIGDDVPFELIATLPSGLADYDHYYLKFTDHLDAGFVAPSGNFVVTVGTTAAKTVVVPAIAASEASATTTEGNITVTVTKGTTGTVIEVVILDVKASGYTVAASDKVKVEYSAKLDTDAVIGKAGNYNDVKLEYSNNPNNTGNGTAKPSETNETQKDGVVVFTYEADITKYDSADNTKALLAGAKFVVMNSDGTKYLKQDLTEGGTGNTWVAVATEPTTTAGWEATDATIFTSDATNKLAIKGLDDGTYKLKEIEAPSGYNKLTDPVSFTITATTTNAQNRDSIGEGNSSNGRTGEELTAIKITYDSKDVNGDVSNGTVDMEVANSSGTTLPSTGGMGTTLFVVGGGVTMAAAGIYLVSKKRSKDAE